MNEIYGVQTIETTTYETCSFETTFIWDYINEFMCNTNLFAIYKNTNLFAFIKTRIYCIYKSTNCIYKKTNIYKSTNLFAKSIYLQSVKARIYLQSILCDILILFRTTCKSSTVRQ